MARSASSPSTPKVPVPTAADVDSFINPVVVAAIFLGGAKAIGTVVARVDGSSEAASCKFKIRRDIIVIETLA